MNTIHLARRFWLALALVGTLGLPSVQAHAKGDALAPTTAQGLHGRFAEAFNAGSVEQLLALYEPQASFVPQPGQRVSGTEGVRGVLQQFLALKGTLKLTTTYVVEAGDVALLRGKFQLKAVDANGKPVALSGNTIEVARRQANGEWLYLIDFPNGAD